VPRRKTAFSAACWHTSVEVCQNIGIVTPTDEGGPDIAVRRVLHLHDLVQIGARKCNAGKGCQGCAIPFAQ